MAKDRSRIYLGDTAVLSEAIKLDVQHLIQRFVAAGPSTFQTFADVWKHERMGLVPLSSLADGRSTDFLDAVFAECINWMTMSKDARCRIGGLFALYTLFRTQPSSHAQLRIRVTLPSWEGICNAVRNLVGSGFSEAEVVFRRLVDGHAFCLSFNATGQVAALPMSVGDW
ncbi:small nuclear RNA activating complex, subunit SNAP43-domain-containing protein [Hyaloraphidium curvatum]|nr:small nuclear RNA activating complex, subunit SNAP43-domain-containing protein [Hyaloraphidium curvatum]